MVTEAQKQQIKTGAVILTGALTGWNPYAIIATSAIGSLAWPQKPEKPDPYTALGLNSAETGIPVPLIYGTKKIGGNYIWKGPLELHQCQTRAKS